MNLHWQYLILSWYPPSAQVPERFVEVSELALREFFNAIQGGRDTDPCWKKSIYKIICKLDSPIPDSFRLPGCPVDTHRSVWGVGMYTKPLGVWNDTLVVWEQNTISLSLSVVSCHTYTLLRHALYTFYQMTFWKSIYLDTLTLTPNKLMTILNKWTNKKGALCLSRSKLFFKLFSPAKNCERGPKYWMLSFDVAIMVFFHVLSVVVLKIWACTFYTFSGRRGKKLYAILHYVSKRCLSDHLHKGSLWFGRLCRFKKKSTLSYCQKCMVVSIPGFWALIFFFCEFWCEMSV